MGRDRMPASRRTAADSPCPFARMGLWSGGSPDRFPMLQGKCPGARSLARGWEGPSAASETRLTDCMAGSYSNGRDEWDTLSAAPTGRERSPRKRPWLVQPAFRRGRSRDLSLQEGRAASKGREGVRHNRSDCRVNALRVRGRSRRPMLSRQAFRRGIRLRRFHQTPFAEHELRPAPSHSCPIQPNTS